VPKIVINEKRTTFRECHEIFISFRMESTNSAPKNQRLSFFVKQRLISCETIVIYRVAQKSTPLSRIIIKSY